MGVIRLIPSIFVLLACVASPFAVGEPILSFENGVEIAPGQAGTLGLSLSGGTEPYAGMNLQLSLPEGLSLVSVTRGPLVSEGFALRWRAYQEGNANKAVIVFVSNTAVIEASSGVLLDLRFQADGDAPPGLKSLSFDAGGTGLSNEDGSASVVHSTSDATITITGEGTEGEGEGEGGIGCAAEPGTLGDSPTRDARGDSILLGGIALLLIGLGLRRTRSSTAKRWTFAMVPILLFALPFLYGPLVVLAASPHWGSGASKPSTNNVGKQADMVQLEALKDNTLYEDSSGNLSNGAGDHFFVGRTNIGLVRRGLVAFDISSATPLGSVITGAALSLNMSRTISGAHSVSLHRLRADWGEGVSNAAAAEGSGTAAATGDATWLHRFHNTDLWATPGGDFSDAASAMVDVSGSGFYEWASTAPLVEDIQTWLDNPQLNFGWLLKGNEEAFGSAKRFDSRENPSPGNRPLLTVEYLGLEAISLGLRVTNFILDFESDPTGLDTNEDGVVDAADIVFSATVEPPVGAPVIGGHAVYRAYPGFSIALPIQASDPEGTALTYSASDLPAGASLDPQTGLLSWQPGEDQLGPAYIHFTVTDSGIPAAASNGVLIFQILPLSDCVEALCSPVTGCAFVARSIEAPCCTGDPEVRIDEPEAPCPEGGVLHVGRNQRGFGRLENCDRLQIEPFAQGGADFNLHFEARCVNSDLPVSLKVRLETAFDVLVDLTLSAQLNTRPDGYAQVFGQTFPLSYRTNIFALEGLEALLSVTLTDTDGQVLTRDLRLRLTLAEPADIPSPIQVIAPSGEIGCAGCHQPVDPITLLRSGIKDPHPSFPLSCTDCHGGNNDVNTFEEAHVFPETGPTYIKNLAYDQLNAVPTEYVRFVNPGDFRAAPQSCGAASPANDGTGCHQALVESVPRSVMATYAGHYKLPRFMAAGQGRAPVVGAVDITHEGYDPATAPEGTVGSLTALREPEQADRSEMIAAMDIYLPKSCATCHQTDFGPNDGPGKYRSSGCTSCHMVYDDDGLSLSKDPAILGYIPPHPIEHVLTTAIPTEQCAHCHFQGGRIGLSYRGIREGGFAPANTPPNATRWGKSIYGHAPSYYFTDEDNTNSIDETPADLHFTAGMACADCHIGGDVHGNGYISASERDQVGIRCEDCHGTVWESILEDPADGYFKNSKGYPLKRMRRDNDRIVLNLIARDGALEVPQIHDILASGINPRMNAAMGVNDQGFAHPDRMECYTCHNAWRQTCVGCHVLVNDDISQLNLTTGQISQGGFNVFRDNYSLDFFALGTNSRGKISPLCSSMSVFVSYRQGGRSVYQDRVRQTAEGTRGFGWNPFHHHTTTRRNPMSCDTCHPVGSVENPLNQTRLDETYGFGNGEMLITDGDGTVHDVTAFLDGDGNLVSTFAHPGTGPVSAEVRNRALSVVVE